LPATVAAFQAAAGIFDNDRTAHIRLGRQLEWGTSALQCHGVIGFDDGSDADSDDGSDDESLDAVEFPPPDEADCKARDD
jgi:hypothetical protein